MVEYNPLKTVEKVKLDKIKTTSELFYQALVVSPKSEISSLPEDIFVGYFLDFFCGKKAFKDYKENIIAQWISIAGSPTKSVNIIDRKSKEVLFTVPGLIDTSFIDITNTNRSQPLNNIFTNYELHKNQLPIIGQRYLSDALEGKMKSISVKSDEVKKNITQHQKQWLDIFIRYGKIEGEKPKEQKKKDTISDDEMFFE